MTWILHIDTALETAIVSLAADGKLVCEKQNTSQKDHASFIQPAIQQVLALAGISIQQLEAVAVVNGPGSYTGLRVGMASAKGLCYALNKPLIVIGSLEILAVNAIDQLIANTDSVFFCPMIDARRMEVFTAVYDNNMKEIVAPCAMELNETSFVNLLLKKNVYFFGDGASKWQQLCTHKRAHFMTIQNNTMIINALAYQRFISNTFANLTYSEPAYLKEFFSPKHS